MAKINVLVHTHRHGSDIRLFRGGENLPSATIASRLGLDFEPDRDDEDLEELWFDEAQIQNVDELPDPAVEAEDGDNDDAADEDAAESEAE